MSAEIIINDIDDVHSVTNYLNYLFEEEVNKLETKCYRGQSNLAWGVKPSVLRQLKPNAENTMLLELFSELPDEFATDKIMFDKLVRAQHYSLPTRLLDVTLNPLVALFFACENKEEMNNDGCVYVYHFPNERVKFADSDTVSLICNLSRLSDDERVSLTRGYHIYKNKLEKGVAKADALKAFRALEANSRLIHFIREEKTYFRNLVSPRDLFRYFLIHPRKNNKRVVAQSGIFIGAGLLQYQSLEDSIVVDKLTIPSNAKPRILDELNQLNINAKSMFPDVEKVSEYIKKTWQRS